MLFKTKSYFVKNTLAQMNFLKKRVPTPQIHFTYIINDPVIINIWKVGGKIPK